MDQVDYFVGMFMTNQNARTVSSSCILIEVFSRDYSGYPNSDLGMSEYVHKGQPKEKN